jgi:hypothetical protein
MDNPGSNPDVAFLLDLLALLPRPDAHKGFWAEYAELRSSYDLPHYVDHIAHCLREIEAYRDTRTSRSWPDTVWSSSTWVTTPQRWKARRGSDRLRDVASRE